MWGGGCSDGAAETRVSHEVSHVTRVVTVPEGVEPPLPAEVLRYRAVCSCGWQAPVAGDLFKTARAADLAAAWHRMVTVHVGRLDSDR